MCLAHLSLSQCGLYHNNLIVSKILVSYRAVKLGKTYVSTGFVMI